MIQLVQDSTLGVPALAGGRLFLVARYRLQLERASTRQRRLQVPWDTNPFGQSSMSLVDVYSLIKLWR
jgi:hypothetical protein